MNEQTKCWTSENTSIIRSFLSFPGVPTAPVGTVPLDHFLKWSLNQGEVIEGGFQHPPQHSEAGSAPCLVPAPTTDLQEKGILSLGGGHTPWKDFCLKLQKWHFWGKKGGLTVSGS